MSPLDEAMDFRLPDLTNKTETVWKAAEVDQESLYAAGKVLHVARNFSIFTEGDETVAFYEVLSGVVRTYKFQNCGRRQIVAFHVAGDVFGLEQGNFHRLSAEAVSTCKLRSYCWRKVKMLALNNKSITSKLLHNAMHNLTQAQDHSLLLARRGAIEKVAAFLLDYANRLTNKQVIDFAMGRQDIADYLGLTIEAISRALSQFHHDDVIKIVRFRKIFLKNIDALKKLAG